MGFWHFVSKTGPATQPLWSRLVMSDLGHSWGPPKCRPRKKRPGQRASFGLLAVMWQRRGNPTSSLHECRLPMLLLGQLALAANGLFPPFLLKNNVLRTQKVAL